MSWRLFYYDEVALDVRETKNWCRQQQIGLDKRFADDVKQCIMRIQKNPEHYEVRYKDVRLAHCETFPYSIHFYLNSAEKQIVIIAIVHQHRDPSVAKSRDW